MADIDTIQALVFQPGRFRVISHWATWCSGCIEELPVLIELHRRVGTHVDFIGISWDAFQGNPGQQVLVKQVDDCMHTHQMNWDCLVVDGAPEDFFSGLSMDCQTVPQLWLVGPDGTVIHQETHVLKMSDLDDLLARVPVPKKT